MNVTSLHMKLLQGFVTEMFQFVEMSSLVRMKVRIDEKVCVCGGGGEAIPVPARENP
jgi:hypothetical protein